ncbi:ATP-binding protein [bacterium]|nr:ATP-binding protein [bacterium]
MRELIANAIDEHSITGINEPIKVDYNEQTKTLTIEDFGRGIKNIHFIQNESNEKKNALNTIGKFGIGLKDAIAVLVRHHVNVTFSSNFGIYTPIITRKEGIKEDISTIHMQCDNNMSEQKGTIITISPLSIEEVNDAKSKFAIFKQ